MAGLVAFALGGHVFSTHVSASGAATQLGTSSSSMALQHPAEDKVAYLHDGSLLVGYYNGSNAVVDLVKNPSTSPATMLERSFSGSEVSLYTQPGASSTDIWIQVGAELGGSPLEQIQHGVYDGTTFTWDAVTTVPGAISSGRQDPSVTWTGKWVIATWWDDTMGSNSDNVFINWTTDKSAKTGWQTSATLLTSTAQNTVQVHVRHSSKLGATIVFYAAHCNLYYRTLLDSRADPSASNWTGESMIDGSDDCEGGFGGPTVAIDENTGTIHMFKALTNSNGPSWSGITYWNGTPDATPMSTGSISWSSRVVIDSTGVSSSDPPDVAGAVDSSGRVYVIWVTSVSSGSMKYVTLSSPYTSPSAEGTISTTGSQPRYPHVPAQAPLTQGFVPIVYQSGTGSPYSIYLDTSVSTSGAPPSPSPSPSPTPPPTPPPAPTGLNATAVSSSQINLAWTGSNGATSYKVQRSPDGTTGWTQVGTSGVASYADTGLTPSTTYYYRVVASNGNGDSSPSSVASATTAAPPSVFLYFNWFDLTSPGMMANDIHLLNNSGSTANVTVSMPGAGPIVVAVASGTESYVSFGPGHLGGPVVVSSDQQIQASQRVEYYSTFNEVPAEGAPQAATSLYINWYDKASAGMYNDNIHILNPGGMTAHVSVSLPGAPTQQATVAAGSESYVTFPNGTIGGPVAISSDQPVLASQRVQYYSSFNEVWAEAASAAATTSYVNWYDKASAGMYNDNIHLLNPGGTTAHVTVSVPGAVAQHATVTAGGEAFVTFPGGTIGGPVTITSDQAVLASQRVQYYSTFNEVWAESAAQATTTKYVIWYDKASAGMMNDNIHLVNPGGTVAHVQVSIGGAPVQNATVAAGGGEAYVTFPNGTIGGPVTITSDQPILASQRVQYYGSFNENWAA